MTKVLKQLVFSAVAIIPLSLMALAGGVIATSWSSSSAKAQDFKTVMRELNRDRNCPLRDDVRALSNVCEATEKLGQTTGAILFQSIDPSGGARLVSCACPSTLKSVSKKKSNLEKTTVLGVNEFKITHFKGSHCLQLCAIWGGGGGKMYEDCIEYCTLTHP